MKTNIATLLLICLLSYSASYSQGSFAESASANTSESYSDLSFRYYYYPNLQAYFDSKENLFLFRVNKSWISAESIPENYGGYSLYNKHRIKITDYVGENITELLPIHKLLYPYNSKGRLKKENS